MDHSGYRALHRGLARRVSQGCLASHGCRLGARLGDLLRLIGHPDPPLTSKRLANMRKDTSDVPLEVLREITGPLPHTMEQGVEETVRWLRERRFL